jgi:hypothetical protein
LDQMHDINVWWKVVSICPSAWCSSRFTYLISVTFGIAVYTKVFRRI